MTIALGTRLGPYDAPITARTPGVYGSYVTQIGELHESWWEAHG